MHPIILLLWNTEAESFKESAENNVIKITNAQIDFQDNKRILTLTSSTEIIYEPNDEEAAVLKKWFNNNGKTATNNYLKSLTSNQA